MNVKERSIHHNSIIKIVKKASFNSLVQVADFHQNLLQIPESVKDTYPRKQELLALESNLFDTIKNQRILNKTKKKELREIVQSLLNVKNKTSTMTRPISKPKLDVSAKPLGNKENSKVIDDILNKQFMIQQKEDLVFAKFSERSDNHTIKAIKEIQNIQEEIIHQLKSLHSTSITFLGKIFLDHNHHLDMKHIIAPENTQIDIHHFRQIKQVIPSYLSCYEATSSKDNFSLTFHETQLSQAISIHSKNAIPIPKETEAKIRSMWKYLIVINTKNLELQLPKKNISISCAKVRCRDQLYMIPRHQIGKIINTGSIDKDTIVEKRNLLYHKNNFINIRDLYALVNLEKNAVKTINPNSLLLILDTCHPQFVVQVDEFLGYEHTLIKKQNSDPSSPVVAAVTTDNNNIAMLMDLNRLSSDIQRDMS